MIELRTFGQIDLRDAHGQPLNAVLQQPKRAALLIYLAAARPRGFHRRDTLLGLFWPELDDDRARAALRKTVFHLRRALGENVILSRGDGEIGLDFQAVSCDAALLQDAWNSKELQGVVDLYTGGFLPGFFVEDAPGFEDWMERERTRLRDVAFDAAWSLATESEQGGDTFAAAHYARHAASLTPDDEAAFRQMMQLLYRIGDHAGALAAYDDFARRLQRDLDATPSAETRALAQSIRADDREIPDPLRQHDTPVVVQQHSRKLAGSRRSTFAMLGVIALLTTAAVTGVRFIPGRVEPPSAGVIAVMPFTFRGAPEFSYLSEGMVNLLSTNLDHVGRFRATDAALVLASTQRSHERPFSPAAGAARARDLGAAMFVLGDIVEVNGRLRVSAALYDARRPDQPLARASAENEVSRLFDAIDAITSQLVAHERRTPAERFTRLALLTTHSMPALRSYLIGEQQFRAGRYTEAVESFQSAVAADTTFALGYYRLALAHMWGSSDSDRAAAQRAIAHGRRLAGPDRALLEALLPFFRGDADEAERQYRAILVTRPDESEVWYPLGEVLFHHNSMRGRRASEAKQAFQRALSLGPKDGPLTHLLEIAAIERDWVAFDSLFAGIQPASHFFYVGDMIQAFRSGNIAERNRVLNTFRDSSDARLTTAARHALFLLEEHEYSDLVLDLMVEHARPSAVRSWGYVHRAHLAVSSGRPDRAVSELARAASFDAERALEHEAWLMTLPFVRASRADLLALRNRLAARQPPTPPTIPEQDLVLRGDREIHAHVRLYLLGLLSAQLGEQAAALQAATDLTRLQGTVTARDLARDLAHAVRAEVLRTRGLHAEALAELERARLQFDANRLNVAPFYAQVRERFVRGELLAAAGRTEDALGWFGSFDEHGPWGRAVLAPAALWQARIHESLGKRDEAVKQYTRFLNLWQNAEPRFAPLLEQAQQRLTVLRSAN